jgi:hypothetical protein
LNERSEIQPAEPWVGGLNRVGLAGLKTIRQEAFDKIQICASAFFAGDFALARAVGETIQVNARVGL